MKTSVLALAAIVTLACQARDASKKAEPAPEGTAPEGTAPQGSNAELSPSEKERPSERASSSAGQAPKQASGEAPGSPARMLTPPKLTADGKQLFGAELTDARKIGLAELLSKPQSFEGATVRIEGTARRVCSRKGCWMELAAAEDDEAPSCRVKFKDYAFFVPTDSAGSKVTVEGMPKITTVKAGRVRHLEREGARFASKNTDGSANEVQLVATGVEMLRN